MDFDASMVGENNDRAMRPLNRLVFFFFNQDTAFYTVGARHSHDMFSLKNCDSSFSKFKLERGIS